MIHENDIENKAFDCDLKRIAGKISLLSNLIQPRALDDDFDLTEDQRWGLGSILEDIADELTVIKETLYPLPQKADEEPED